MELNGFELAGQNCVTKMAKNTNQVKYRDIMLYLEIVYPGRTYAYTAKNIGTTL